MLLPDNLCRLDLEFSEGNCEVQDILDWDPGTKVLDSVTKICEYCLKEFVGDGPQQMVSPYQATL